MTHRRENNAVFPMVTDRILTQGGGPRATGRSVSVVRCREINARLRAAGITVHEFPGWESRGNGQSSSYEGGVLHHTASAFGMALWGTAIGNLLVNGRTDLRGPLTNYATNEDGSISIIAAHPANHAGASGGRSMGPLPVTTLFNKTVLGNEIVYPGNVPMRESQYRSALVWSHVVADVVGFQDIQRVRAHAETSITGKWDPGDAPGRTINMTAFRAAAWILGQQEEDMTPEQDRMLFNLDRFLTALLEGGTEVTGLRLQDGTKAGPKPLAIARQIGDLGTDVADVRAAITTIKTGGVDYALLAKAIADEMDLRTRDNNPATGPTT